MVSAQLTPPERLTRIVTAGEGPVGRAWLAALPGRAAEHLERWELTAERVLDPGGRTSMIVLVRQQDGTPAVLKLGMVNEETEHEHAALAHWNGHGAVRLLRADPAAGALLLERLRNDVSLRSLAEPKAMLEAEATLQRLWVPPAENHPFLSVTGYTARLLETMRDRGDEAGAGAVVDEALSLRERLVADPVEEEVLLHGDYHHGNVLAGERTPWLAIDPRPKVGERAYDLAWLVRDRLHTLAATPGPQAAARRRIHKLADALEVDRERLRGWTYFRSVEAGLRSLATGDQETGRLLLEFAALL